MTEETFKVKISEPKQADRYVLTVSNTGQIQSTTTNKGRAADLTGKQVNNISNYIQEKKFPYQVTVE